MAFSIALQDKVGIEAVRGNATVTWIRAVDFLQGQGVFLWVFRSRHRAPAGPASGESSLPFDTAGVVEFGTGSPAPDSTG